MEFRKLYTENLREGKETELIKNNVKDLDFYYSITCPRKFYHKVIKFFSDLVEF